MHTIPARPSPPPRSQPPCTAKGACPPHAYDSSTLYTVYISLPILIHTTHTSQICTSPRAYHGLHCNQQSFTPPMKKQVCIYWWNYSELSSEVFLVYDQPCSIIRYYSDDETIRPNDNPPALRSRKIYRSPDNASEDLGYRSIQRLIASGKALLIHCEHHSLCA